MTCAGSIDFLELAPENWLKAGGRLGRQVEAVAERYPLVCHGPALITATITPE
jgi:uncharacterized protein (UPF0276 family)